MISATQALQRQGYNITQQRVREIWINSEILTAKEKLLMVATRLEQGLAEDTYILSKERRKEILKGALIRPGQLCFLGDYKRKMLHFDLYIPFFIDSYSNFVITRTLFSSDETGLIAFFDGCVCPYCDKHRHDIDKILVQDKLRLSQGFIGHIDENTSIQWSATVPKTKGLGAFYDALQKFTKRLDYYKYDRESISKEIESFVIKYNKKTNFFKYNYGESPDVLFTMATTA